MAHMKSSLMRILNTIHLFLTFAISISVAFASGPADTVFINGNIVTVDAEFSIVEAIAITDDKFSAVGTNNDIKNLVGPATDVIDLQGKTVVPGFIDGHAHLDREGLKYILPSMHGVRSIADILDVIAEEVRNKKAGEWIVTMPIGDYPYFASGSALIAEQRYPTRWELDRVAPDNPVYIKGIWYYWSGKPPIVSIANSYALRLAGITKDSLPPHAGVDIGKDDITGEPNGIFRETGAIGTVEYSLMQVAPRFSYSQRLAALKDSMWRYNAVGTTSIYEGHGISPVVIRAYKELREKDELTVRSHLVVSPTWDAAPDVAIDRVLGNWAAYASGRGLGDDMLRISGIHTAVGDSPLDDIRKRASSNPGWAGYSVDSILHSDRASLHGLILVSARAGLRVNGITHNAATLDEYLSALEKVNEEIPIRDLRFVLQHLSFVSDENLTRLKELGIISVVVPGTTIWKNGLRRTVDLTGAEASTYVPLKSFLEHGVPFVFATDNVPIEPMKTLWGAITREDAATGQIVVEDQIISRADALRAFTINGAYLSFEEDKKGSIEIGKFADLAVLSADLLTVPADEVRDIRVLMTVVGGITVFKSAE
jgi:predicted amidohydrolase YtcJ